MALSVALTILWPVLLLPLFLRSEPLAEGRLAEELWRTIRATGVAVKELRLLHMGEKTSAANAMVAGLGPTLRVYVGDTIAEGSEAETGIADTRLVLAHELGPPRQQRRLAAAGLVGGGAGGGHGRAPGPAVRWLAPDGPGHLTCLPALMIGFTLASARSRRWARPTRDGANGRPTRTPSRSPARASATRRRSSGWSTRT